MATICSGIGAPEVASIGLGFTHEFMAEIEPFPSAVLAHHWPHVPNLGDMTKIDGEAWRGQVLRFAAARSPDRKADGGSSDEGREGRKSRGISHDRITA